MTDKDKIREEVERLQNELIQEKEKGFGSNMDDACILELQNVLTYIDSLQEEPSKFDAAIQEGDDVRYNEDLGCRVNLSQLKRVAKKEEPVSEQNLSNVERNVKNWEEPVSEDVVSVAKQYIDSHVWGNEEDKFTRSVLVDMFCSGAKWQKQQFENNRLKHCNSINEEQYNLETGFIDQHIEKNNRMPTFLDAIEYGMRLKEKEMQSTIELAEDHAMLAGMEKMKEEMMAKAIDGDVTFDYYSYDDKTYGCIAHDSFCLEDFGLKDMDKVKMILIKESKK